MSLIVSTHFSRNEFLYFRSYFHFFFIFYVFSWCISIFSCIALTFVYLLYSFIFSRSHFYICSGRILHIRSYFHVFFPFLRIFLVHFNILMYCINFCLLIAFIHFLSFPFLHMFRKDQFPRWLPVLELSLVLFRF